MTYQIKKAAVIGSGTMGGGIAALLAGVGIPTLLLDIAPRELTKTEEAMGLTLEDREVRNRIVEAGWKAVQKARPPAILSQRSALLVTLGNLDDDFDKLSDVDWIVEVIVENLEIKRGLFERIDAIRKEDGLITTNTSGLPIQALAEGRSDGFQQHFLGTHFFNPPRWLKLLELIPHDGTAEEVLDFMRDFSEEILGKGVVICKDTPNFIANRMFSIANSFEVAYALEHGYGIEEIDTIAGVLIGRPKTAIFRLLDLIGNDIAVHVGKNLYELIPEDESREVLRNPKVATLLADMVERKWLGNKTKSGFYKQVINDEGGKEFWVLDPESMQHQPPQKPRFDIFKKGRKIKNLGERLRWIVEQVENPEADKQTQRMARYIWATTSYALGYASRRVPEIADRFVDIDQAMKWGFANEIGPFEIWDGMGVKTSVERMLTDGIEVAPWVQEMLDAGFESFYQYEEGKAVGFYDLQTKDYQPLAIDPRHLTIEMIKSKDKAVVKTNDSASLIDMGDKVGLIEFHSTANALDQDIFEMAEYALDAAEDGQFDALVIGNEGQHFCAGANIMLILLAAQNEQFEQLDQTVEAMQKTLTRMRYFPKPIVAAPFGMVLGGGAELSMSCAKRVAAAETFIGLVEVGIGVLPAGTGSKEMLRRVVNPVMRIPNADPVSATYKVLEQIALAKVTAGAFEAFEFGFFQPGDRIIMNKDYLLAEAKKSALAMVQEGYRPPTPELIYAAGRDVLAMMELAVWSLREADWATEHDVVVANKVAWVLCGGDLTEPTWVPEEYILDLERKAFIDLCHEEKTVERIAYMLQNNKPLRN
jgi:3-hydroxyacyl-CoA dehydrogenase